MFWNQSKEQIQKEDFRSAQINEVGGSTSTKSYIHSGLLLNARKVKYKEL